jgi:hypothetical protein
MSCLAPCPTCNRHVSSDETTCPFCAAVLPESLRCRPARRSRLRVGRAAMFAAGAALLGADATFSCSAAYGTPPPVDSGASNGTKDGGAD